jgi:raffinose/stachyose/melibiose transport system substrate-binding protein
MTVTTASGALTRRSFLSWSALGAGSLLASSALAGCSSSGGRTSIRFLQNKPEVISYFTTLTDKFNRSQTKVRARHDATTTALTPQFVRGAPPDLACYNYNLETANFLDKGALIDLADLPEAKLIAPNVQALVNQFASYKGQTNVIPYSVTSAGCIYNQDHFEKYDVQVPTTWSELIAACKTFKSHGITPVYTTFLDTWTLSQGIWDYVTGSNLDVAAFFKALKGEGGDVGPSSQVSFSKDFEDATNKIVELYSYSNSDAASRGYNDGNAAFAAGKAAMYLQGPWAVGEVAKANPKLRMGTFALPGSDDATKTKCRVNLDLALWIPHDSGRQAAARSMMRWLLQPSVMNAYNAANRATSLVNNPPPVKDKRVAGLNPYVQQGKFYQGAGTYISASIPLGNYLQELLLSGDVKTFLTKLDGDWARRAARSAV